MIVQHNLQAMNANRMLGNAQKTVSKTTEKLTSGYRVNRAADDKCLEKLFGTVINNEDLNEYEFGLEEKIVKLISKNGLKKDFVDKYVINLQGETKK